MGYKIFPTSNAPEIHPTLVRVVMALTACKEAVATGSEVFFACLGDVS